MSKKLNYTYKEEIPEDDIRDKVIFARVRSGLYGRLWHLSQESGMSMSKLAEICLEEHIYKVEQEVMSYGLEKRKEKYGHRAFTNQK